jgi:hypothetical protein
LKAAVDVRRGTIWHVLVCERFMSNSRLAWSISSATELTLSLLGLMTNTLSKRAVSVTGEKSLAVEWELLVETGISGIGREITEQHGVAVRI